MLVIGVASALAAIADPTVALVTLGLPVALFWMSRRAVHEIVRSW